MVENFAVYSRQQLRTIICSRSQPPVFALMVERCCSRRRWRTRRAALSRPSQSRALPSGWTPNRWRSAGLSPRYCGCRTVPASNRYWDVATRRAAVAAEICETAKHSVSKTPMKSTGLRRGGIRAQDYYSSRWLRDAGPTPAPYGFASLSI